MAARLLFVAALLMAGCGGRVNLLPEPFTRERADGKIPVKTELIRQQVRAELAGMPEGEAEVVRWQAIEADYHSCRLSSKKAKEAAEEVFADCMANRGYVYMYPIDAEQLHNDIAFEMKKAPEKWQGEVVAITVAASPITITNTPPQVSDGGSYTKYLLGIAAIGGIGAAVAGGGGGDSSSAVPNPRMTMTLLPLPPPTPTQYEATSPELGAWHIEDKRTGQNAFGEDRHDGSWLIIIPVSVGGLEFDIISQSRIRMERQRVTYTDWGQLGLRGDWPARVSVVGWNALGRERWHDTGNSFSRLIEITDENTRRARYPLDNGQWQILFATRTDITQLSQLCSARWLGDYINENYAPNGHPTTICHYPSGTSYSPNIRQVVYAAMADGFNRGVGIGKSAFSFSGRYDGNKRAAGFTYDLGGYALRTDYIRLPSKQDSEVWLDTYRFGALTRVNDEMQLFSGVDSYKNAIIAINANGDNMHRLGFAIGDGYAVKYEYRFNL